ncbi:MAG TPA: DUF5060 domain-containing protein [Fimbriimonadales bacterium]|nr:DUF5060 domain-containing protein [Fimbriimonadales bacterium]
MLAGLVFAQISLADLTISPEIPKKWQPVEIAFHLKGDWKNSFDPGEIDAKAVVDGPGYTSAEIPAFYAGGDTFKVRFSPWSGGTFGVAISCLDKSSRLDYKRFTVKVVAGKGDSPFVEVPKSGRYFEGKFVVFGGFDVGRLEKSPAGYDLNVANQMDLALAKAADQNRKLIVSFGNFGDWRASPYNAANGGPCATQGEFWTSLQARIQYKKLLRYIFARANAYSSFGGALLWPDTLAPAYWIDEMANEVYALHPYNIPIACIGVEPAFTELMKVSAAVVRASDADVLADACKKTKKPVIADGVSPYLAFALGASGAIASGDAPGDFDVFLDRFDLRKRKLELRTLNVPGGKGWASIDGKGGALYLMSSEVGEATIALKSSGAYDYFWIDPQSGKEIGKGELLTVDGVAKFAHPAAPEGVAGILEKR